MTTKTHTMSKQGAQTIEAQPRFKQRSYEIQQYGQLHAMPLSLPESAIKQNVECLNHLVADSITLYSLYKKHHWQMTGPTFYQLHLLLDEHAEQIEKTIDLLAERVQQLGGVTIAMPHDVAELTKIERPPKGVEDVPAMLSRLVSAHATVIQGVREGIELSDKNKDYTTNDILTSEVLPLQEMQTWFISQHLVDTPFASFKEEG
ncbi:DNA starvation/stationary phase protection protein [Ktedonobacter sp. SOSP1-52]|uniref:Dps family protein n=1 Tax=Ktedonobacter sp. SOSP1-52 TaxID=2778366 RepID=UPI001915A9EE|nr:DNA starvation/stationary phase protection protein [Ktedonobacter sp. SOSP1-52]GHO64935.1 DNA starvation/stationary phase protection protein [Ktedonobacter sp. SOSP1-52]